MMQAKEVLHIWHFKGSLHVYQGVDKMANIFQMHFFNDNICILIQTSLTFVPKGLIDSESKLVQLIAWCH